MERLQSVYDGVEPYKKIKYSDRRVYLEYRADKFSTDI